ncbi:MAG: hypothetical protein FWC12_05860 [Treponema sp.]|nr:hypothetical protein [Treponema sp.]
MNIVLLIVFVAAGVGLGLLFNLLVIKHFPEDKRKGGYVKSVVLFLIVMLVAFGLITARNIAYSNVKKYSNLINQFISTNNQNLELVKNGINMAEIKENAAKLNNLSSEIISMLPSSTDLGIPGLFYNMASDFINKELQKKLVLANTVKNIFTDDNNILSITSILTGLEKSIMKIVNNILLVIAVITFILFMIFIISSIITASKEKKAKTA